LIEESGTGIHLAGVVSTSNLSTEAMRGGTNPKLGRCYRPCLFWRWWEGAVQPIFGTADSKLRPRAISGKSTSQRRSRLAKIPSYDTQGLYQHAAGSFPLGCERTSLSFYLRERDRVQTDKRFESAERIPPPELRKVKFALPSSLGVVETAEVFVVADSNPVADSEAMNSPGEPHRVSLQSKKAHLDGHEFDYNPAPFAVTLLELRLAGER
jgi:hypothetical protein